MGRKRIADRGQQRNIRSIVKIPHLTFQMSHKIEALGDWDFIHGNHKWCNAIRHYCLSLKFSFLPPRARATWCQKELAANCAKSNMVISDAVMVSVAFHQSVPEPRDNGKCDGSAAGSKKSCTFLLLHLVSIHFV